MVVFRFPTWSIDKLAENEIAEEERGKLLEELERKSAEKERLEYRIRYRWMYRLLYALLSLYNTVHVCYVVFRMGLNVIMAVCGWVEAEEFGTDGIDALTWAELLWIVLSLFDASTVIFLMIVALLGYHSVMKSATGLAVRATRTPALVAFVFGLLLMANCFPSTARTIGTCVSNVPLQALWRAASSQELIGQYRAQPLSSVGIL